MKLFKKTYWLIYPVLIVLFLFIYDQFFDPENFILKIGICGAFAFILSPRKKIVQTQTGKIKQVTWLFLKKPVIID